MKITSSAIRLRIVAVSPLLLASSHSSTRTRIACSSVFAVVPVMLCNLHCYSRTLWRSSSFRLRRFSNCESLYVHERISTSLDFSCVDVLPPGQEHPDMPERISQAGGICAIEHVRGRLDLCRAGPNGPLQQGLIVVHENVKAYARTPKPSRIAVHMFVVRIA